MYRKYVTFYVWYFVVANCEHVLVLPIHSKVEASERCKIDNFVMELYDPNESFIAVVMFCAFAFEDVTFGTL